MAEYLYGTYGHLADSVVQATAEASTVALYVGTAVSSTPRSRSTTTWTRRLRSATLLTGTSTPSVKLWLHTSTTGIM